MTALLHDVIEDTDATKTEIDQLFGSEIGGLVDGLTKIKKLDLVSKKAEQAENFRKLLIAISSDIRVLLVKLADRLHNMRTLEHMKAEKRAARSRRRRSTFMRRSPAAWACSRCARSSRIWRSGGCNPDAYRAVGDKLTEIRTRNQGLVEEITAGPGGQAR